MEKSRREQVQVCFTQGHKELSVSSGGPQGLAEFRRRLEQNNYRVREADLADLYEALVAVSLADPGAGTVTDVKACPGADTCRWAWSPPVPTSPRRSRRWAASCSSPSPAATRCAPVRILKKLQRLAVSLSGFFTDKWIVRFPSLFQGAPSRPWRQPWAPSTRCSQPTSS